MIRAAHLAIAAGLLAAAASCSDSPTGPTAPPDPVPSPTTVSFPGAVGPGGSVSRSFVATRPGTATVALSAVDPDTALGVGLGVPRPDGLGCLLAQSAVGTDSAPAQVSTAVDAGSYCTQIFAPATAADPVRFTVTLVYP
jgi:hypothetical protein